MTVRSLQEQVDLLLSRKVAEDRNFGRQSVDLEASALQGNFATTLLLNPRVVLYFAHLARNGLLKALQDESSALQALSKDIDDLGNVTTSISSTTELEKAKTALLQLENQETLATGPAFKRLDAALSSFLDKRLSKNVRRHGSAELVRPAEEARQDLPGSFTGLLELHSAMLSRLFALSVGVQNFQSTPLTTTIGSSLAFRVRDDIQDIIDEISVDSSGARSRDYAIRTLAARASLRAVVNPPQIEDPVLDTEARLPKGYALSAYSSIEPAIAVGTKGPFANVGSLSVTVDGVTEVATPALGDGPTIVGEAVAWPITVPGNHHLFFSVDGVSTRVVLNQTDIPIQMSLAQVASAIQDAGLSAGEFCKPGTSRLMVSAPGKSALAVDLSFTGTKLTTMTSGAFDDMVFNLTVLYTNSAHELAGLPLGTEVPGYTAARVVDGLNAFFTKCLASVRDEAVVLMTTTPDFGTQMTVSGNMAGTLGLAGTFYGQSDTLFLTGSTPDGSLPNPSALVSRGDTVSTSSGSALVKAVSADSIVLQSALRTFSGPISVKSGLYESWGLLNAGVRSFILRWRSSPFMKGLGRLGSLIAVLAGSSTPAQRAQASDVIKDLADWLADLVEVLESAQLPEGGASLERPIAENLLSTLTERKYDLAVDLLSQCRVSEFFDLDYQSMSYGGSLLKASSDLARADLVFPNRAKDEDLTMEHNNAGVWTP